MTLEGRHLTVKVNRTRLLNDVSLRVEPGEIVAVIGPNGAGKSTLLRALSGDLTPETGDVLMAGRPLSQWSLRERAQVRGILSQQVHLSFAFNVLQVVLMGRGPHTRGLEAQRDYEIVHQALETAEVLHLRDRLYTTLSGGERQRVQLARVLAQIWEPVKDQTRYLMMDEPTNNLDLTHQHRALCIARDFARQDVAILVVLHDLNLAAQYADRLVLLHEGAQTAVGTPRQVLTAENIQATFNVNVLVAEHPVINCPFIVPVTEDQQAHLAAFRSSNGHHHVNHVDLAVSGKAP